MKEVEKLAVRKEEVKKTHSIIALNLQTVDDVEQVIRQCEALKEQMSGGLKTKISELVNSFEGKLT